MDYVTQRNEARRALRLVVSFIASVVNYEYLLYYYYFRLDGTVEFEIKLLGKLFTNKIPPNESYPAHGTLVAPNVNVQQHHHVFCVRIDPSVDGEDNTVEQVDIVRTLRSKTNP